MSAPNTTPNRSGEMPEVLKLGFCSRHLGRGERQLDAPRHHLQTLARGDILLGVEIDNFGPHADRKLGRVEQTQAADAALPRGQRRSKASAPMPIGLVTPMPVMTTCGRGEIMASEICRHASENFSGAVSGRGIGLGARGVCLAGHLARGTQRRGVKTLGFGG